MNGNDSAFRICTRCGYGRGFHVSFEPGGGGSARLVLICPSCGQSYRLGWLLPAADLQPRAGELY